MKLISFLCLSAFSFFSAIGYADVIPMGDTCEHIIERADSYVFALSWQPAFCETYGYAKKIPECQNLPADAYASTHLTLHGLWPDQGACKGHYWFCETVKKKTHCDYPPLVLNPLVAAKLRVLMPSYEANSCLERHEWTKHGSCQARPVDLYFGLAVRLAEELNQTSLQAFLAKARGMVVSKKELEDQMIAIFGDSAMQKIAFRCTSNVLTGIYIRLPAYLPEDAPLAWLIKQAPDLRRDDNCPKNVVISDFHVS